MDLVFTSTRPNGFGLADIWVSQRDTVDDPWGPPQKSEVRKHLVAPPLRNRWFARLFAGGNRIRTVSPAGGVGVFLPLGPTFPAAGNQAEATCAALETLTA